MALPVPDLLQMSRAARRSPIRVLLADDHGPLRGALRDDLEREGCTVCVEAHDAPSAIEGAARERPDVCLLDVHMPGSGTLAAYEITARDPRATVIMLTASRSRHDALGTLRAGARLFLSKELDAVRLVELMRAALEREVLLCPLLSTIALEALVDSQRSRRRRRARDASETRRRLLELMREGRGKKEVAACLAQADEQVEAEVDVIRARLRFRDRSAALAYLSGELG